MKYFLIAFCLFSFQFCYGQKPEQLNFLDDLVAKKHTVEELKSDIDFVHLTLKKNHPNLYLYISKKKLDFKFDSLKKTITEPLISRHLRGKLITILSAIGDGHLELTQNFSSLNLLEFNDWKKYNDSVSKPFYQFNYRIVDEKLYVVFSPYNDIILTPGTEILAINGISSTEIIKKIQSSSINSDGLNTTLKNRYVNNNKFRDVYLDNYALLDTVTFKVNKNNKSIETTLYSKPSIDTKVQSENSRTLATELWVGLYAKIAINSFNGDEIGWEEQLKLVAESNIKYLVLDLRYNGGGNLYSVGNFLRYFINKPTDFMRTSKNSCDKLYQKPVLTAAMEAEIAKFNKKNYILPADKYKYNGPLYVLVNGQTFSASAILASKLKELPNVTFVGEEIGGGYHYTAGFFDTKVLPNSKLTLRYGLLPLSTTAKEIKRGRGLLPDIKVNYTLKDYLENKDVEWDIVRELLDNKIN